MIADHDHDPVAIASRLREETQAPLIADAVLGAVDGCITTFALAAGAVGAGYGADVVLILGAANVLADGFSMAVSNYEAIKSDREFADAVRNQEERHIARDPDGEREEIRQIYAAKGFDGDTLDAIVRTITADHALWVETMLREEYGLRRTEYAPVRAATVTFAAFLVAGAMPLLPFLAHGFAIDEQFAAAVLAAAVTFFAIGTLKSYVLAQPMLRAGLTTLLTGSAAAGIAYATGWALRALVGVS